MMSANDTAAPGRRELTNGAALASFVAAGIGAFAMGLFVLLHEAGIFSSPAVYGPAGGVSGRTTFAVVSWLLAWALFHQLWKERRIDWRRPFVTTLVLVALGIVATFPPVWGLF